MSITEIKEAIKELPVAEKMELFSDLKNDIQVQAVNIFPVEEEKKATVEELAAHLSDLESWLKEKRKIQVIQHGHMIAWITFADQSELFQSKMPLKEIDYTARHKKRWGDKVFTEEEMRGFRQDSQGELYDRLSGQ